METVKKTSKTFFGRKRNRIMLSVIAVLVIIRLILPFVVLHYANKTLANMRGYHGHINDIDLSLYRGAYVIKNIYLHKKDTVSGKETDFFESKQIDLSVHWKALFNGKIAGELEFEYPALIFTKDKTEPEQVRKDTADFRKIIKDFMPLDINRFAVNKGLVKYKDAGAKPPVDLSMKEVHIVAENLTNVKSQKVLPSTVVASALVYGGELTVNMKLDPLAEQSTFDFNAEAKNIHLPELNSFFKAYGNFDVNKGVFGLYTEAAAKDGKLVGYVKPVIKDLDVVGPEDKKDPALKKIWEGLVGASGVIFKNVKHDQVATKIPLEGSVKHPGTNLWYAVMDILRNAFIQALRPSIDHEINIKSVAAPPEYEKKGFFNKLFSKDDEKKKEEDKSGKDDKNNKEGTKGEERKSK
jgi:hypothetical protein